jgi:hypothetical protein
VKCFTQHFVEFKIRLFAGKGEYGHGVIVEAQRQSGSSVYFHNECRAIFDAAEGMDEAPIQVDPFEGGSVEAFMKEISYQETAVNLLGLSCELLKKNKLDANLLGIQSLVLLTDSKKSGTDASLMASKSIIVRSKKMELQNIIAEMIETGVESRHEDRVPTDKDIFTDLRYNSLTALCNALNVCAEDGCLSEAIVHQSWYMNILVPLLSKNLGSPERDPLTALLSLRCLNILLQCSVDCRRKALGIGTLKALENAREFGEARYSSLATETVRSFTILERAF